MTLRPPAAYFNRPQHLLTRAIIERFVGHPTGVLRHDNSNDDAPGVAALAHCVTCDAWLAPWQSCPHMPGAA